MVGFLVRYELPIEDELDGASLRCVCPSVTRIVQRARLPERDCGEGTVGLQKRLYYERLPVHRPREVAPHQHQNQDQSHYDQEPSPRPSQYVPLVLSVHPTPGFYTVQL